LTSLTGPLESTQERTFLDGMPNGQIDLSDTLDGAYVIKKSGSVANFAADGVPV
jgi:hypothetical protein